MTFVLFLLVAAAWGSLWLPAPKWLKFVLSFVFIGMGLLMVVFGGFANAWDKNLNPSNTSGGKVLTAGILILLSRAWLILRAFAESLLGPPSD
jgi:hypothetical protein